MRREKRRKGKIREQEEIIEKERIIKIRRRGKKEKRKRF